MEINKQKEQVKSKMDEKYLETEAKQKVLQGVMMNNAKANQERTKDILQNFKKDLERDKKSD